MLRDIKPYYKALVIKQPGTGIKTDTYTNRREETPEINSCICGQLIYDKGGKNVQWGKDSFCNKWCWENWADTYKREKLFYNYLKINSKWIKNLSIRPQTTKILEENRE